MYSKNLKIQKTIEYIPNIKKEHNTELNRSPGYFVVRWFSRKACVQATNNPIQNKTMAMQLTAQGG